jgi:hypothetical protein
MVKRFEPFPVEESQEAYRQYFNSLLRDNAMHQLGVGTTHTMHSVIIVSSSPVRLHVTDFYMDIVHDDVFVFCKH